MKKKENDTSNDFFFKIELTAARWCTTSGFMNTSVSIRVIWQQNSSSSYRKLKQKKTTLNGSFQNSIYSRLTSGRNADMPPKCHQRPNITLPSACLSIVYFSQFPSIKM